MKENIKKEPDDTVALFRCAVCLEIFEVSGEIDKIAPEKQVICEWCMKDSTGDALRRIDEKIECLKEIKKLITND